MAVSVAELHRDVHRNDLMLVSPFRDIRNEVFFADIAGRMANSWSGRR
jgi:hypothetical protein